ncbi:hypothetical protein ACIOJD_31640 [Streptomyces sp. NPDC088116]|uniref:hypothetical protein n=1 Tax=Streptomyces sp. NPDC088116 TaxID=3365825 RepID=UPI0038232EEF
MSDVGSWRPPRRPERAARAPVLGVLTLMAALTAGWPLIDRALNDHEPVRNGAVLQLGPDDDIALLRVVGEGWELSKSASDPDTAYTLSRDGVDVVAGYVDLSGGGEAGELWSGLRKVQSVADGDSRLGGPRPVTGTRGAEGRTGTLTRDGRTGTATLWLPPDRSYAVEVTVLAKPRTGPRARADAAAMARGVSFPQGAP